MTEILNQLVFIDSPDYLLEKCTIVDETVAESIFRIINNYFQSSTEVNMGKSTASEIDNEKYVFSDFEDFSDFEIDLL